MNGDKSNINDLRDAINRIETKLDGIEQRGALYYLEKVGIPLLLGALTILVSFAGVWMSKIQLELQENIASREEKQHDLENKRMDYLATQEEELRRVEHKLKFLELFWSDYTSESSFRQKKGLILLPLLEERVVSQITSAIASDPGLEPGFQSEAVSLGSQLVDQNLSNTENLTATVDDPSDVIAVMSRIEALVKREQYSDAVTLVSPLKSANRSGVGYSTYPAIILAFEKTNNPSEAKSHIIDLKDVVTTQVLQRSGFLDEGQTIATTRNKLQEVITKFSSPDVIGDTQDLINEFGALISDLSQPRKDPESNAMSKVLPAWLEKAQKGTASQLARSFTVGGYQLTGLIETLVIRGDFKNAIDLGERYSSLLSNRPWASYEPFLAVAYDHVSRNDESMTMLNRTENLFLQEFRSGHDKSFMEFRIRQLDAVSELIPPSNVQLIDKFTEMIGRLRRKLMDE